MSVLILMVCYVALIAASVLAWRNASWFTFVYALAAMLTVACARGLVVNSLFIILVLAPMLILYALWRMDKRAYERERALDDVRTEFYNTKEVN